jgi:hypothetical protein
MVKCRYHWGKLKGLGHGFGNFVFQLFFNYATKLCKNTGNQSVCRNHFDIDIVEPKPPVNRCSNTLNDFLERGDASL